MRYILITGINSGIGLAAAASFLEQGDLVIGSVRNLNQISKDLIDLKNKHGQKLILWTCDFLDMDSISSIKKFFLENNIQNIDVLVNNAGIVTAGPIQNQDFSEVKNIINTNVLAVIKLTQLVIPYLIFSRGRIINISSVSGINGAPFLAAYCASKFAIEGFSESLRREMNLYGIKVSIIGPGSIKTPIWFKGFDKIKFLYEKTAYAESFNNFLKFAKSEEEKALPVQAVISDIIHAANAKRPKARYAPIPRRILNQFIPWLLPKRLYEFILCKTLGLNIKNN